MACGEHQQHQLADLVREGHLDEQFYEILRLEDEHSPCFVAEVVQLYLQDSSTRIERIGAMLQAPCPDYQELDQVVHQFRGSSASLGARLLSQLCERLRAQCQQRDTAACAQTHQLMAQAWAELRVRLAQFVVLEAQRKQLEGAGGSATAAEPVAGS